MPKIKGIEFLLLSIQQEPGKSQRHHIRKLYMYRNNEPFDNKGGHCHGYFRSPIYKDVLWADEVPQDVKFPTCHDTFSGTKSGRRPKSAQLYLTSLGIERANKIRKRLGMPPHKEKK